MEYKVTTLYSYPEETEMD